MNIEVDSWFRDCFLVPGYAKDNYVFNNCPVEFLQIAKDALLLQTDGDIKTCVVSFGKEDGLVRTLENCTDDYQRSIIARSYLFTSILQGLMGISDKLSAKFLVEDVISMLKDFESGSVELAKKAYIRAPFPNELNKYIDDIGKLELDLLLDGPINKFLQQHINQILTSRTKYPIKVFHTGDRFSTYYTANGQIIQSPHDYMSRNIMDFIQVTTSNNEM